MLNQEVPSVVFKTRVRDDSLGGDNPFRWQDVTTEDVFKGRRVVVFSLPGAFTPTCSNFQCPSYDLAYEHMKSLGVDEVHCISVNDAFVMYQWGLRLGVKNVKLLPDGNGDFTRRMGMLIDKTHLGFGFRSWRYSMVVHDMKIEQWFEEPGINDIGSDEDPYVVTDADTMVKYLESVAKK